MSFINPLSVENHDFDGIELGSYIVYWSMVKYHVIRVDDWRSISLESIYTGSFPEIQPHPKYSELRTTSGSVFAWSIMVLPDLSFRNISKFFPYLLVIKTSTIRFVANWDQLKIEKNSSSIFSTLKCEIKVRGKYSVNRVFNGLAHHRISHSPLLLHSWQRRHAY